MKTLDWLLAGALGLGLAACNDNTPDNAPPCDGGVELEAGGGTYCASLITETGFLCPASLPAEFDFDGYTVCLPDGETPSDELVRALCSELADAGYTIDPATGACLNPDNEPVVPVAVGTPDVDEPDARDAGSPDGDGPDPDAVSDVDPIDAGAPDGEELDTDEPNPDAATDVRPGDAGDAGEDGTVDIGGGVDAGSVGGACLSTDPFACEEGSYCRQEDATECLRSYVGVCTAVPPESEWDTPFTVCGCNGEVFDLGEGEARANGYGGPIVACAFSGECPAYALACPSECFEMSATRYDAESQCLVANGFSSVVGCTSIDGGSDDTPCAKRLQDGALFIATSGTAFEASMEWVACTEEEQTAVFAARPCDAR